MAFEPEIGKHPGIPEKRLGRPESADFGSGEPLEKAPRADREIGAEGAADVDEQKVLTPLHSAGTDTSPKQEAGLPLDLPTQGSHQEMLLELLSGNREIGTKDANEAFEANQEALQFGTPDGSEK